MPKVSICIPAYKQIEHLRKTLSSIKEQDFDDYEIIVSDDSPNDMVKELINEFDFKEKLIYFYNQTPLGSPANWNFAIQHANGEYVKIMHHDDYFTSKNSLRKFVLLLDENKNASFAFSGTQIKLIDSGHIKNFSCSAKKLKLIQEKPSELFLKNYIGAPSATIFRKSATILFDVNLKWLVDIDWYIQIINANPAIVNTSEKLVCTIHGAHGQITQSVILDKNIQIKEHLYVFDKLINQKINWNKFSIYFQLLFHIYEINLMTEIISIYNFNKNSIPFFEKTLKEKNKNIFFKKLVYWLNRYTLSDYLYLIKKQFK